MAKVEVRPLPIPKWHGKEGKDSFAQPSTIEVLYDNKTGGYATGLTKEEEVEYSQKLGGVSLSSAYNPAEPHPYWSTKAAIIKLPNYTVFFETDRPAEYVKVKNMKASSRVANSFKEWQDGKFPNATHYIFDETEEAEIKATKYQRRLEASQLLAKMSPDEMASMVQIIGEKSVRGQSPNYVIAAIGELAEEKPDEFLKWAKRDKSEVYVRGAVLEATHRSILTKEGTAIYYMGDKIGSDIEDAIQWFMHPDNQKAKTVILSKLTTA